VSATPVKGVVCLASGAGRPRTVGEGPRRPQVEPSAGIDLDHIVETIDHSLEGSFRFGSRLELTWIPHIGTYT
jgi:hypothetical protein